VTALRRLPSKEPNPFVRWGLLVAVVLWLIGGLSILVSIPGGHYLPSTSWISQSLWPAITSGAFCAVWFTLVIFRSQRRDEADPSSISNLALLAFTPLICGGLGYQAVATGAPLLYASLAGQPTELSYVVETAARYGDRKCRNPVELQGLPFLTDRLCGLPEEFTKGLRPGDTVIVSGNGTPLGLFVASARPAGSP
jgi:hypothetical protein